MTTLTVGSWTFDGSGSTDVDVLERLDGWYDGTDVRADKVQRPGQNGSFETPVLHGGRTVSAVVSRRCWSDSEAGAARRDLAGLLAGGEYAELVVSEPDGHVTTSRVRLAARTLVRWLPYSQRVQAQVEFYAPDPLRYGPTINRSTTFATSMGGLEFDLFTDGTTTDVGYLDFGAQGSTGRIVLPLQDGTAPGATQFLVEGPVPRFSIVRVESGRRISFSRPVAAGDSLLIDPATGSALLNGGDVDYSGLLTRWEWDQVLPGEPATFAFLPDGEFDTGTLTVIHRAAWW